MDKEPLLGSDERSDARSDADTAGAAEAAEWRKVGSTAQTERELSTEEKARLKAEVEAKAKAKPAVASTAQAERERSTPQAPPALARQKSLTDSLLTGFHNVVDTVAKSMSSTDADAAGAAEAAEQSPPGTMPEMKERTVTTEKNKSLCFKHGLVEFEATGTRAKYLIVPADCEDEFAVLRAALRAWGLSLPNLVVSVQGGQTCPENWWYWLPKENSVWTSGIKGNDDQAVFNDAVKQLYVGVAKACAESKAWVYSWNDCIGGVDVGFEGKTELFGRARRSAGLKDNDVVHLAAFHQGGSGYGDSGSGSGDLPLWNFEMYEKAAVDVQEEGEQNPVTNVVQVPKMKDHYCQIRETTEDPKCKYMHFEPEGLPGSGAEAFKVHAKTVPQGQVTHLILHEKGCRLPRDSILEALQKLIPCPALVANGREHLLPIWVQMSHENPVIILSNTGGAADVLAEAVRRSRNEAGSKQPKQVTLKFKVPTEGKEFKMSHALSKGARESQFVVLDAHQDSTERVVDRLIQCMSVVDDDETRSLGFHRLELERLQAAWGLFLCIVAATLEPK